MTAPSVRVGTATFVSRARVAYAVAPDCGAGFSAVPSFLTVALLSDKEDSQTRDNKKSEEAADNNAGDRAGRKAWFAVQRVFQSINLRGNNNVYLWCSFSFASGARLRRRGRRDDRDRGDRVAWGLTGNRRRVNGPTTPQR